MNLKKPKLKAKFKKVSPGEVRPADPESLFRDLKGRSSEIQHLWSHQADLIRSYDKNHLNTPDIALELPTGTGKTLIGLLLAEYRRQKFDERAVYLCPTRQLANQVGNHAIRYGIKAHVLLSPEYDGIKDYLLNRSIGITTYSSLFNINPRINDPQVIILDDSHSSEDYIANLWSVTISRRHRKDLYFDIIRLLSPEMEKWFVESMLDDSGSPDALGRIDKLPHPRFCRHMEAIRDIFDQRLKEGEEEWYSWSMIRGSLHACFLFICWHELLIRPIIPPTMTHPPFANARQRIYMSATLGEGGELERITGVRNIQRLPIPEGWNKQSSGRRLFLFPNLSLDDKEVEQIVIESVKQCGRSLVLTPRIVDVSTIGKRFSSAGIKVMGPRDIEESLASFTSQNNVVLILANRYDGIDLPSESCRLLIFQGLPAGTNLQERFLLTRLGTSSLLRDRLRTRFTQGVGRCCRSSTDYAAVLVVGQKAFDFCARTENRSGMHPELQAEIFFGIENSRDVTPENISELVRLLCEQGEEWSEADKEILHLRESMRKEIDPAAQTLMKVVAAEVDFVYELWRKNYLGALDRAIEVSDALSGDDTVGYRAWWYYMAGCAAWLAGNEQKDDTLLEKARDLFGRASKCSLSLSWLAELSREAKPSHHLQKMEVEEVRVCEAIYSRIVELGFNGPKFVNKMSELINLINQDASDPFERGIELLGKLLGFESLRPGGEGTPDGVWILSDHLAIAFEAKSDETPTDPISLKAVRQASTHEKWLRDNCSISTDAEVFTLLITPRTMISKDAQRNAGRLFYINIGNIRKLAETLVAALRRVRAIAIESDQVKAIEIIHSELHRGNLLPAVLIASFKKNLLKDLPVA